MSSPSTPRADVEDLVAEYRADLVAAGMFAGHPVTSLARTFFARVGTEGWERMPLEAQCALPLKERRVVGWLMVTGRVRPAAASRRRTDGSGRPARSRPATTTRALQAGRVVRELFGRRRLATRGVPYGVRHHRVHLRVEDARHDVVRVQLVVGDDSRVLIEE